MVECVAIEDITKRNFVLEKNIFYFKKYLIQCFFYQKTPFLQTK